MEKVQFESASKTWTAQWNICALLYFGFSFGVVAVAETTLDRLHTSRAILLLCLFCVAEWPLLQATLNDTKVFAGTPHQQLADNHRTDLSFRK